MGLANVTAATIADAVGYAPTFITGLVLSAAGCLALVYSLDARRGPARLQPAWQAVPGRLAVADDFR
jgi:hypothetical protein